MGKLPLQFVARSPGQNYEANRPVGKRHSCVAQCPQNFHDLGFIRDRIALIMLQGFQNQAGSFPGQELVIQRERSVEWREVGCGGQCNDWSRKLGLFRVGTGVLKLVLQPKSRVAVSKSEINRVFWFSQIVPSAKPFPASQLLTDSLEDFFCKPQRNREVTANLEVNQYKKTKPYPGRFYTHCLLWKFSQKPPSLVCRKRGQNRYA